jgi:hypothetical protein
VRSVFILSVITLIGVSLPAYAQAPAQGKPPEPQLPVRLGGSNGPAKAAEALANRPVPKLADGTTDLSGVWTGGGLETVPQLLKPGEFGTLLTPAARKILAARTADPASDPYFACMPGGPLRITGGFAWRLVQHPTVNATHIFMLQEGNAHSYRQIFMNAKHPEDPTPTWYGHSVGRWEGDTLVIDTIGINDKFWLDSAGTPHGEKLHMVERWSRPNYTTLRRVVRLEDPDMYTRPIEVTFIAKLSTPGSEIMEYFCIENEQFGARHVPDPTAPGR